MSSPSVWLFALIALLGASLSSSHPHPPITTKGQEIIGPIEWECAWNGVYPYPDACDQYVECWDNVAMLWQCTDLMLFDLNYNGCNYAQYTHCDHRPRPTNVPSTLTPTPPTTTSNVSTSTTEAPSDEFDCPADGVFAHEERCEYYWNCYAGDAQLIHCPLAFLFDLVYMGCNFPEYTHCQDRLRPPGAKPTINPPPTTTTSTTPTPEVEPTAGPTTTFNPNATTIATTTTTTTLAPTTSRSPGGDFDCPPGVEGDFADPDNCSAFYTCSGGVAHHNYCPAGLFFNPVIGICDYPENVDCDGRQW